VDEVLLDVPPTDNVLVVLVEEKSSKRVLMDKESHAGEDGSGGDIETGWGDWGGESSKCMRSANCRVISSTSSIESLVPMFSLSSSKEKCDDMGDSGESECDGEEGGESSKYVGKSANTSAFIQIHFRAPKHDKEKLTAVRPKRLVGIMGVMCMGFLVSVPSSQSTAKCGGSLSQSGAAPLYQYLGSSFNGHSETL
jgi:hypothetical protein